MLNKNIRKILLLLTLCFLLVGIVSATNATNTPTKTKTVKETKSIDTPLITKKNDVKKTSINKENIKTASKKNTTKLTLTLSKNKAILNDKIKIKTTLTTKNNKAIKNQKIALKVGSKTYNLKTNSQGTATLNYKITNNKVLGKNITATYKGNDEYKTSKASKLLSSNEAEIYKKIMTLVGKDYKKMEKPIANAAKKINEAPLTYNDCKVIITTFNSAIKNFNKDEKELQNLKKYITNNTRKTYIDMCLKQNVMSINLCSNFLFYTQSIKSYYDGEISDSILEFRLETYGIEIDDIISEGNKYDKKVKAFEKKYPFVIKGIEKYV